MTRLGIKTIVACGLLALLTAGAWFAAVGITLGIPPHASGYVAPIDGRLYHADRNCEQIQAGDVLLPLPTLEDAERFGHACPKCHEAQGQEDDAPQVTPFHRQPPRNYRPPRRET